MESLPSQMFSFPMGPKVRSCLGINDSEYKGGLNVNPSHEEIAFFQDTIVERMDEITFKDGEDLANVLEELVGMNFPYLAIKIVDANLSLFLQSDFRSQLHLGNSCLMVGEYARAEDCFRVAQKLVPEEPAPYINLTQIYCEERRLEEARLWCVAGLNVEPNNLRMWELVAWIFQQIDFESSKEEIKKLADKLNSWAGHALYVDLNFGSENSVLEKLKVLEPFYNEGLRSSEFLIEFTATLGMAGQYERIPTIIWQVEKQSSKELSWQLHLHCIQAFMGLGRDDQAREVLEKALKLKAIPDEGLEVLNQIKSELNASNSIH